MTKLQSVVRRLYFADPALGSMQGSDLAGMVDSNGRVRAIVLSLAKPADWSLMSTLWKAVQQDLGLPAPAIAVSGLDAYQLWFSLAEPLGLADAHAFIEALRKRYLGHIESARVGLFPPQDGAAGDSSWQAFKAPSQEVLTDQWSAFVAPDLAPMFAETPWLDVPPSPDGQAELLSALRSIEPADLQIARQRLQLGSAKAHLEAGTDPIQNPPQAMGPGQDPGQFLLDVMNDQSIALALRIEAAKALLLGGFPSIVRNGGQPHVVIPTNTDAIKGA